jgi:hypothetical protein
LKTHNKIGGFKGFQVHPMEHTETSWHLFTRFGFTRHHKLKISTFLGFLSTCKGPPFFSQSPQSKIEIVYLNISQSPVFAWFFKKKRQHL